MLIDVHHHAVPPVYRAALSGIDPIPGVDYPEWEPDSSLEVMDRNGITAALLSITAPGVSFADPADAPRLARQVNEYFAGLVAAHPNRFGAFAVLPLPDIAAAKDELAYAVDELGLDGVNVLTSYRGEYLGSPAFEPLFAEIAERGVVVHVHPAAPPARDLATFGLPPSLYEFTFETTRTVVDLLFSGVLDRLPDLRMILSHAGGTLPFLAKRLTYGPTIGSYLEGKPPVDLLASLRRLHYDIAMSATGFALPALTELVGADHVLFGSDYPFMPDWHTEENVAGFAGYQGWTTAQRSRVASGNALDLFPALRGRIVT